MARKAILETGYTFTPSTNTIIIPRVIPRERLILITNVTTNQVIYNFSDQNLKATTYTISTSGGTNTTTVILNYSTSGMTSTDKLQIIIDEYDEKFSPSETYTDPINKFRVSEPQALIDTDFEYGSQITKWENLGLVNNRPFSFPSPTPISNISSIVMSTNSRTVTVSLSSGTAPANGTSITVQDTLLSIANGNFIIESGGGTSSFTYTARTTNTTTLTGIFDTNKTLIYQGNIYTSAAIGGTPTFGWTSGTALPITTTVPHGLAIGNRVAVVGTNQTNANGSWIVATINSATQFTVYVDTAPGGNPTGGNVYVLPSGLVLHRPFDGGVIFSANAAGNYESIIRQTRRYFRYQSGKGLQISSGTILKPTLQLDSLTSVGTTVTVQTKESHNILSGTTISVSGANETAYNGTFTVTNVTGFNTFQYTAGSVPSSSTASGTYYVNVNSWYGASNRLGAFDAQNGLFFEFDGQTLYAVRRSSTYQLAGRIDATQGSNTVTQSNSSFPTYFAKQLNIGDFIVIRGVSYRVIDISGDTSLTISPSYRGTSSDYVIISNFMNDILVNNEEPKNIYIFCEKHAISEADFYSFFGSFDTLKQEIWVKFFENATASIEKDEAYKNYTDKDKLLALNTQRCDAMLASPFFTLLKTGALSSPDKLAHFYKHLRMWSDKFQRILFMRQATVADGRFEQVFKQHLFEEIGHNDMLPTSDEWDAVVDTCGDWFVMKMLVLDNREKLAVVQLVLEKCGDLYHSMAKSALKIDDDYIDTHAKHDHSHAELGMELFDGIDETTYSQLARLCSQSWDVLEMMLNRIAALAK